MSAGLGFQGQEFATGERGFRSVILAEDRHDADLMLEAAAGIPGFKASIVPAEEAVNVLGRWAREMGHWADNYSDDDGPVPHTWYYDEQLARDYMTDALHAGKLAVRIAANRVDNEYPNAGAFYQNYYALRDGGH